MKYFLLILTITLAPIPLIAQALPFIPQPYAAYISPSGTGAAGSWNPLTGTGGMVAIPYIPAPIGIYYSNDGSGAAGTWVPWTGSGGGGGAVSSVSNSDGSLTISPTTGSVVASLNPTNRNTYSATGAANTPAYIYNQTPFSGGTGTTTFPYIYISPSSGAPTITTFNTSGTILGANFPNTFTGDFLAMYSNGVKFFSVSAIGAMSAQSLAAANINTGSKLTLLSTTANLSSDASILFSSTTNSGGGKDVGIDRKSVGVLEVNNGTVGNSNGTILFTPISATLAVAAGAGTGASITCVASYSCNANYGTVSLVVGTSPATGIQFTVTAATAYASFPSCNLSAATSTTAAALGTLMPYAVGTSTSVASFGLNTPTVGTYTLSYRCN